MRNVLVTGASTGIGRATALRLDAGGWRVFAGVRREQDAQSLREAGSASLEPLILDVTDAEQIAAAATRIGAAPGGLHGEHALTARHPRTRYLVGLDAQVQARLRHVIPTRVLDRIVAHMMGL